MQFAMFSNMTIKKRILIAILALYIGFFNCYFVPVKQAEAALPALVAGWAARKVVFNAGKHLAVAVATKAGIKFATGPAAKKAAKAWFQRSPAAKSIVEKAVKVAPGSVPGWVKVAVVGTTATSLVGQTYQIYEGVKEVIEGPDGIATQANPGEIPGHSTVSNQQAIVDSDYQSPYGEDYLDISLSMPVSGSWTSSDPISSRYRSYSLLVPGKVYQNITDKKLVLMYDTNGTTPRIWVEPGQKFIYSPSGQDFILNNLHGGYTAEIQGTPTYVPNASDSTMTYSYIIRNSQGVITDSGTKSGTIWNRHAMYGYLATINLNNDIKVIPFVAAAGSVHTSLSLNVGSIAIDNAINNEYIYTEKIDPGGMIVDPLPAAVPETDIPLVVEVPDIDYIQMENPALDQEAAIEEAIRRILNNPDYVNAPEAAPETVKLPDSWYGPDGELLGYPYVDPTTIPTVPGTNPDIPDDTELNFSPFLGLGTEFTTKFPFSLPWDLYNAFNQFLGTPWDGLIEIRIDTDLADFNFDIDLSVWEDVLKVVKTIELILFDMGLIILTRRLMGGGV